MEEKDEDGGEGCFAGGKIFLTAFASPPTSDFSHSSLRSLLPFRGTFSTDACAFPDFISLGKIIVALARALPPVPLCICARIYSRPRSVRVRGFIRVYYVHICKPICECVCVNDARTMALNWRLTGEQ